MKISKFIGTTVLSCLIMTAGHAKDTNPSSAEGKTLFQEQCASCHNVNKQLIGPALAGVDQRHTEAWILQFVKSPMAMIKGGDKEATALYNKFQIIMPDHPGMSNGQIESILSYIKSATVAESADKPPFARPAVIQPDYLPLSLGSYGFFGYLLVVLVLILVLLLAVKVKDFRK